MSKIGRNSPCPCGSGKKYKKCCIDQPDLALTGERLISHLKSFWSYEEVNMMETGEIIQRLESMGIMFDKEAFLKDVTEFYTAEQISKNWFKNYKVLAEGRDEDFPFFAAWILWERLAPSYLLSMEQMTDLIDEGEKYFSEKNYVKGCDIWLKVWEALKYRFKNEFKDLEFLQKQYEGSFFLSNFCQDLEQELYNAGRQDKAYFEKRIDYCKEFLSYFPDEDELLIHNMRRVIAETYESLGNYKQAELEYEGIVKDFPDNPWGFIGWGDMYHFSKNINLEKAKELYSKALDIAKGDEELVFIIEDRIEDLEKE